MKARIVLLLCVELTSITTVGFASDGEITKEANYAGIEFAQLDYEQVYSYEVGSYEDLQVVLQIEEGVFIDTVEFNKGVENHQGAVQKYFNVNGKPIYCDEDRTGIISKEPNNSKQSKNETDTGHLNRKDKKWVYQN